MIRRPIKTVLSPAVGTAWLCWPERPRSGLVSHQCFGIPDCVCTWDDLWASHRGRDEARDGGGVGWGWDGNVTLPPSTPFAWLPHVTTTILGKKTKHSKHYHSLRAFSDSSGTHTHKHTHTLIHTDSRKTRIAWYSIDKAFFIETSTIAPFKTTSPETAANVAPLIRGSLRDKNKMGLFLFRYYYESFGPQKIRGRSICRGQNDSICFRAGKSDFKPVQLIKDVKLLRCIFLSSSHQWLEQ